MAKHVIARKVVGAGWDGDQQVRLDLANVATPQHATRHMYVPPDDPLASLPEGTEIVIVAGSGLIEALKANRA